MKLMHVKWEPILWGWRIDSGQEQALPMCIAAASAFFRMIFTMDPTHMHIPPYTPFRTY